jgi:hypothetical protein
MIPIRIDNMPTRPINIAEHKRTLEASQRSAVMPSDDPTVNSAEQLSNRSAFVGKFGSNTSKIME